MSVIHGDFKFKNSHSIYTYQFVTTKVVLNWHEKVLFSTIRPWLVISCTLQMLPVNVKQSTFMDHVRNLPRWSV